MQVKKKRNIIFANVFLLLVLVAGATYAWFAINTTANVTVSEVEVKGPGELEMKLIEQDAKKWTTNLTLTEIDFDKLKMVDVSGKGNGIFYRPNSVGATGEPAANAKWLDVSSNVTNPENTDNLDTVDHNGANKDYMKIDLQLRAQSDSDNLKSIDVYLKEGSKISTVAPTAKLDGADAENKSTFGNFSKDYVVGGIRVSAMPNSTVTTDDPLFLWIPEPNVELNYNSETKTYSILTTPVNDQTKHTYVSIINNNATPKYSTELYTAEGKVISGQIAPSKGESKGTEREIVSLNKNDTTGYYEGRATFYVWLEGCDTEARRALVGGKFRLQLLLDTKEVGNTQ